MITIYKYDLPNYAGKASLYLPQGAKILSIKNQHGIVQLWALVDTSKIANIPRDFLLAETGNAGFEIQGVDPEQCRFIDTVLMSDENYILHVFEIMDKFGNAEWGIKEE